MTNLKQNLIERSQTIQMLIGKELEKLDAPCTIADLTKRVQCSRMPIETHLKHFIAEGKYGISVVKVGGYDII